jgi:hypothetical protein
MVLLTCIISKFHMAEQWINRMYMNKYVCMYVYIYLYNNLHNIYTIIYAHYL